MTAYKWLSDANVDFEAQVPMTSAQVLNTNGSVLDGKVTLADGTTAYFDVKAFGFVAHKIQLLRQRLEEKFSGKDVPIEGDWHVSIDTMQHLHDYKGFAPLLSELQNTGKATRGTLQFRVLNKQPVAVSVHGDDPLNLAKENRAYPLRFASQYTRNNPFFLIFVIHPWFSQGALHQNFNGFVDRFAEQLSQLAFESFANDRSFVDGVPRADAAQLLSGLVFLNGWPPTGTDAQRPHPFCRIFINGHAKHAVKETQFSAFQKAFGDGVVIRQIGTPKRKLRTIVATTVAAVVAVGLIAAYIQRR